LLRRLIGGQDSVVGTATFYGLDCPGFEPRWVAENFWTRPDRPRGPPSPLYNGYRLSFPGLKRPERDADFPPPSSAEVEYGHGYTLPPLCACLACNGTALPFYCPSYILCYALFCLIGEEIMNIKATCFLSAFIWSPTLLVSDMYFPRFPSYSLCVWYSKISTRLKLMSH
jgi:hypothetical protein